MSDYAWKKQNTRTFAIMLNKNTCADVIDALDKQESRQAYIVDLIRADIKKKERAVKRAKRAE